MTPTLPMCFISETVIEPVGTVEPVDPTDIPGYGEPPGLVNGVPISELVPDSLPPTTDVAATTTVLASAPPAPTLPSTGTSVASVGLLAAVLLAAGVSLVRVTRR